MSRNEVLFSKYGEFADMITCLQIESGALLPKEKAKTYTFDEAIQLL